MSEAGDIFHGVQSHYFLGRCWERGGNAFLGVLYFLPVRAYSYHLL